MNFTALSPQCPKCGSPKIVYSCEPKCCFNHVCGACKYTFQLETRELEALISPDELPDELPEIESCMPTAACAKCESLRVYETESPEGVRAVCADCFSLLELVYAENEE